MHRRRGNESMSRGRRTYERSHKSSKHDSYKPYNRSYGNSTQESHYDSRHSPTLSGIKFTIDNRSRNSTRPQHLSQSQHTTTRYRHSPPGTFTRRERYTGNGRENIRHTSRESHDQIYNSRNKRDGDSRYSPDMTYERRNFQSNGDQRHRVPLDLHEELDLREEGRYFVEENIQRYDDHRDFPEAYGMKDQLDSQRNSYDDHRDFPEAYGMKDQSDSQSNSYDGHRDFPEAYNIKDQSDSQSNSYPRYRGSPRPRFQHTPSDDLESNEYQHTQTFASIRDQDKRTCNGRFDQRQSFSKDRDQRDYRMDEQKDRDLQCSPDLHTRVHFHRHDDHKRGGPLDLLDDRDPREERIYYQKDDNSSRRTQDFAGIYDRERQRHFHGSQDGSIDKKPRKHDIKGERDIRRDKRIRHSNKRKHDTSWDHRAKKKKRSNSKDEYKLEHRDVRDTLEDGELVDDSQETIAEIVKTIVRAKLDTPIPITSLFYELKQTKVDVRTERDLKKLLNDFPQCFIVNEREQVSAMTKLKICDVQRCSCQSLHFCKYHLLDKCTFETKCKFSHGITLTDYKPILREHFLHHLDLHELRRIFSSKESRNTSTLPTVCKFYNNAGGCLKDMKCYRLNVCLKFITDDCKFGQDCIRSHNLHDRQPKAVLRRYGIPIECVEDVDELRTQIKSTLGVDGSIIHKKRTNTDESVEPPNKEIKLIKRYFSMKNSTERSVPKPLINTVSADSIKPRKMINWVKQGKYNNAQSIDNREEIIIDNMIKQDIDKHDTKHVGCDKESKMNDETSLHFDQEDDPKAVDPTEFLALQDVKIEPTTTSDATAEIQHSVYIDKDIKTVHLSADQCTAVFGSVSREQTESPAQLCFEQTGTFVENDAEQTESPAQNESEETDIPAQNGIEQTGSPAQNGIEQTKSPAQNESEETGIPAQNGIEQTESPAQNGIEQTESPTKNESEETGIPAQNGIEQTGSSAQNDIEQTESPAQNESEETGIPAHNGIEQTGSPAQNGIEQTGSSAQNGIEQTGSSAQNDIEQTGSSAQNGIEQTGSSAQNDIEQTESPAQNESEETGIPAQNCIEQTGSPAQNGIEQTRSPAQNGIEQTGSPAQNGIEQTGCPAQNGIEQTGSPAQNCIEQTGSSAQICIEQTGSPAQNCIEQTGSPAQNCIEQTGSPAQTGIEETGSSAQTGIEETGSLAQNDVEQTGSSAQIGIEPTESAAQNDVEQTGSPAQNDVEQTGSLAQNDVEDTGSPAQNGIEQTGGPAQNCIGQTVSPVQNDVEQTGSPAQNDVEQTGSPAQNDVEQTGSPAQNDVKQTGSPAQNDVEDTGSSAQTGIEETGSLAQTGIEETGSLAQNDVEQTGSSAQIGIEPTESAAQNDVEQTGSPAQNDVEQTGSLAQNDVEDTGSPAQNGIEQTGGPAQNCIEQTGSPAQNDVEQTGGPAQNDVEQTGSPAQNDVEQTGSPAQNDVEQTVSPAQTGIEEKGSPAQNDIEQTGSPAQNDVEQTGSPAQNDVEDTGSPAQTGIEQTGSPAQNDVEDKGSPAQNDVEETGSPAQIDVEDTGSSAQNDIEQTGSPAQTGIGQTGSPAQTGIEQTGSPAQNVVEQAGIPGQNGVEQTENHTQNVVEQTVCSSIVRTSDINVGFVEQSAGTYDDINSVPMGRSGMLVPECIDDNTAKVTSIVNNDSNGHVGNIVNERAAVEMETSLNMNGQDADLLSKGQITLRSGPMEISLHRCDERWMRIGPLVDGLINEFDVTKSTKIDWHFRELLKYANADSAHGVLTEGTSSAVDKP